MKRIIKKPLVSEKSSKLQEEGIWTFIVDLKATKKEIRREIETFFKVDVSKVRTMICRGRSRRHRHGHSAVPYSKKAYVKLAKGHKITLMEKG